MSSRQNALVKRLRALAHERVGDERSALLDGPHLVEEALASDVRLELAAFAESAVAERLAPLARRLQRAGVRLVAMSDAVFTAASPVQHPSGVMAIAHLTSAALDDVVRVHPQLLLVLDGIQDPGNIGASIRAAEGCGATGVIVGAGSTDAFGWKALRGAMGSSFRLPVAQRVPLEDALHRLRAEGIRVFASVPRGGTPLPECDLRAPSAILLGSEGAGLSQSRIGAADAAITIPMSGPVDSLNVAIASALMLYEASRQRTHVAVR